MFRGYSYICTQELRLAVPEYYLGCQGSLCKLSVLPTVAISPAPAQFSVFIVLLDFVFWGRGTCLIGGHTQHDGVYSWLQGTYKVLGTEPMTAVYKASALPSVLSLLAL